MATLQEMAQKLRAVNPANEPMNLRFIAQTLWPDATWLRSKARNGGARRGEIVAAGTMGRMAVKGLARRYIDTDSLVNISRWELTLPTN